MSEMASATNLADLHIPIGKRTADEIAMRFNVSRDLVLQARRTSQDRRCLQNPRSGSPRSASDRWPSLQAARGAVSRYARGGYVAGPGISDQRMVQLGQAMKQMQISAAQASQQIAKAMAEIAKAFSPSTRAQRESGRCDCTICQTFPMMPSTYPWRPLTREQKADLRQVYIALTMASPSAPPSFGEVLHILGEHNTHLIEEEPDASDLR